YRLSDSSQVGCFAVATVTAHRQRSQTGRVLLHSRITDEIKGATLGEDTGRVAGHDGTQRHRPDHHGAHADDRVIAHRDPADNRAARANVHAIAEYRVASCILMTTTAAVADRHTVEQGAIATENAHGTDN